MWGGEACRVRDHGKCSAAVARLAAFIADFPQSPNQTHVLQYHDIVKTLEETCGQDLSQFRIAPERREGDGAAVVCGAPAVERRLPGLRCI